MKLDKATLEIWGVVAEIVAALGVIVSVVYLAIQIGEGTTALQMQMHHYQLENVNAPIEHAIADEGLAEIITVGVEDPDALSKPDWYRFCLFQLLAFNSWEYGYHLHSKGVTPEEIWEGVDAA